MIRRGLSEEGRCVAHGWTGAEEGYKVLVLTSFRENSQGDDGHLLLPVELEQDTRAAWRD